MKTTSNMFTSFYTMRFGALPVLNMINPNKTYKVCNVSGQTFVLGMYRNATYLRKYMQTANGMFLPSQYCIDNDIECVDEENNSFNAGDDAIRFSHSCGWHNADEYVVYDHALYDVEDMVEDYRGDMIPSDHATWCEREDEYVQNRCVVSCIYVRSWDSQETVYTHLHNTWYFNGVRYHDDSETTECLYCGDNVPTHEDHRPYGDYCSSSCEDQGTQLSLRRFEYHTNVLNKKGYGVTLHKVNNKPVYTGIELECYARDNMLEEVNDFSDNCEYAIPTQDGSLSCDYGVEYVFRPEGLEQQIDNVKHFVNKNCDNLYEDGTEESCGDTYGLHIHVSSHFLTDVDKIKIVTFANKYLSELENIGKRKAFGYARAKENLVLRKRNMELSYDRYQLVNTTPNETIEYRFPKSIVSVGHIALNLQLCWAMTMFCANYCSFIDLKDNKALIKFKTYVSANRKQYDRLYQHFYPADALIHKREKDIKLTEYKQYKAA